MHTMKFRLIKFVLLCSYLPVSSPLSVFMDFSYLISYFTISNFLTIQNLKEMQCANTLIWSILFTRWNVKIESLKSCPKCHVWLLWYGIFFELVFVIPESFSPKAHILFMFHTYLIIYLILLFWLTMCIIFQADFVCYCFSPKLYPSYLNFTQTW